MALYSFVAKDASGKRFSGEVEVTDERTLIATLQQEGLFPIEVKQREAGGWGLLKFLPKITGGISQADVVGFTRQLSTMISAGLSITDALVILEKQTKNQNFTHVLVEVVAS